jgi:hypothetical protein
MKNPRMLEEMVYIANRYALAKEVTLDNREKKKESGHVDQPHPWAMTRRENRTILSMW